MPPAPDAMNADPATQHPLAARAPTYRWIDIGLVLLSLFWIAYALHLTYAQIRLPFVATVVFIILYAVRAFPGPDQSVRRRVPLLFLLALPCIIAILFGPLGLIHPNGDPDRVQWMTMVQQGALAASAILALAFIPVMRDARRFTLAVGALSVISTLVIASVSLLIIAPGS